MSTCKRCWNTAASSTGYCSSQCATLGQNATHAIEDATAKRIADALEAWLKTQIVDEKRAFQQGFRSGTLHSVEFIRLGEWRK